MLFRSDRLGFAVQGALSIKNIPTGARDTINMQAVYTDGASRYNFQGLLGTTFARYSGTGLVGAYQGLGIAGIADGVYSGTNPLNGTQIESVKTWGFRGGFNHNWDPHWNSSFYGAYAQLQYSGNAKAQICANVTPKLVAGSTCNPDFNVAQMCRHPLGPVQVPGLLGRLHLQLS